jgi:LysM repeat protein
LSLIARRNGLSISTLKRANRLRDSRIFVGMRLAIPASDAHPRRIVHRVRSGEALTVIAARYRVPVRKIKRLNDLRTNRIYAGQRLVIATGL